MARASWEHVDASVELLLIQILGVDAEAIEEDAGDVHTMCNVLRDYIRMTTISCCESQSLVKDRIPLVHSEAIWFSKKCATPILELMNKVMRFTKGDKEHEMSFGALQGDVLSSVTLCMMEIDQMPLCSDKGVHMPITSLFQNVLERFMYTSDCIDVCRWATLIAKERELDETDGLHHATFEQTQIQLEALLVKTSNLLNLFGGLCKATHHISTQNVEDWGASWRKCLEDASSIMTLYLPFASVDILGMVLSSFSYMMTKSLPHLLPEYMIRQGSGIEDYLGEAANVMRQLQSLQVRLHDHCETNICETLIVFAIFCRERCNICLSKGSAKKKRKKACFKGQCQFSISCNSGHKQYVTFSDTNKITHSLRTLENLLMAWAILWMNLVRFYGKQ